MDIVTHAAMGSVLAAPFVEMHPVAASCFVFGTVAPDLDVLSRFFGKRAFLEWHQTYTHSLPLIALVTLLLWVLCVSTDVYDGWAAFAAGLGMTLHVALDLTNTFGVRWMAPFSRRRQSLEWVFFIDGVVLASTMVALAGLALFGLIGPAAVLVVGAYAGALLTYWVAKALLRRRAGALASSGTLSLVPSALVPWRFFGVARDSDRATTFELSALSGAVRNEQRRPLFDERYADALAAVPEYRAMRELSEAYHAVSAAPSDAGTEVTCRDLRTRNFGGNFGRLTLQIGRDGQVIDVKFHV